LINARGDFTSVDLNPFAWHRSAVSMRFFGFVITAN
jgi:hypothetical protein